MKGAWAGHCCGRTVLVLVVGFWESIEKGRVWFLLISSPLGADVKADTRAMRRKADDMRVQ